MAITTAILVAAGTAVNVAGNVAQGNAAKAQADFQSKIYGQQSLSEMNAAQDAERDFRRQQSAAMAARRARLGASGIELGEGSPLLRAEDFAREAELQARRIRAGGETSSTRLQQQASLTQTGGRSAQTAGYMRAGSSLLTGLGRSAEAYQG